MTFSSIDPELVPVRVDVDQTTLRVRFSGGLEVSTPTARFPRLQAASAAQRSNWRLIGKGDGIHWPEIDEDISVRGLFKGAETLPESRVEKVPQLIGDIYKATQALNQLFPGRPFTPDGHLVGSIGEVIAEYVYNVKLERCGNPQIDAHAEDGRSVQIKLTGQARGSYGLRWSVKDRPRHADLLLCMRLTTEGFAEVYNGPFPIDLLRDKPDQKNGQLALSAAVLSKFNPSTLPQIQSFASINRWFTPRLSDVA